MKAILFLQDINLKKVFNNLVEPIG